MGSFVLHKRLAILLFLALTLVPGLAAGEVWLSPDQTGQGETITFDSNIFVMYCSTGSSFARVLLREPGGSYVQGHPAIAYTLNHSATTYHPNFICPDKHPSAPVSETYFLINGTINTTTLPPGEYELVLDAPYTCTYLICDNVDTRGDRIETAKFRVGEPIDSWSNSPRTINLAQVPQAILLSDSRFGGTCSLNSHWFDVGSGLLRTDATPFLTAGSNDISCSANNHFCGVWSEGALACGCTVDDWGTVECPPDVIQEPYGGPAPGGGYCVSCPGYWKRGYTNFQLVPLGSKNILWSNDNSDWYYGPLPVTDDTPWLEKPHYYNWDETVYTGLKPFKNQFTYFNKWFFVNTTDQILYISSVVEPSCTLNGEQVFLEPQDADWWVFSADVSSQARLGVNQVLCTVEQNGLFNLFDIKLEEFEEEIILPPPPPSPPSPGNYSSPFKPSKGDSQESGSGISPLAGIAAWAMGTGHGADPGPGASPISAQTVSIILSALGAVGAARYLTRRRPSPRTATAPGETPGFWQGLKFKLAPIRYPGRALGRLGGRGGLAIAPGRTPGEAPPAISPYKTALGGANGLTGRFGARSGKPAWAGGAAPVLDTTSASMTKQPRHGSSRFWQRVSGMAASYKKKMERIKRSNESWKAWKQKVSEERAERKAREEAEKMDKFLSRLEGSEWHRMQRIDTFIKGSGMSASSVAYLTSIKKGYEAIRNQKLRLQEERRQRILAERGAGHKPNYTDAQLQEMASRGGELGFWARKELEARQNRSTQDSAPDAGEVFEFGEGSGENVTGGQGWLIHENIGSILEFGKEAIGYVTTITGRDSVLDLDILSALYGLATAETEEGRENYSKKLTEERDDWFMQQSISTLKKIQDTMTQSVVLFSKTFKDIAPELVYGATVAGVTVFATKVSGAIEALQSSGGVAAGTPLFLTSVFSEMAQQFTLYKETYPTIDINYIFNPYPKFKEEW